MHHNRRPTRAEATDVANAILDGADACMLSGETAIGEFPAEAVETMNRIMLATEPLIKERGLNQDVQATDVHPITAAAVKGSAMMADQLGAKLVVVATRGGGTCRLRSKQRDFVPTIGVSDSPIVLRKLSLFWGVTPLAGARCTTARSCGPSSTHGAASRESSPKATGSSLSPARIFTRWRRIFW